MLHSKRPHMGKDIRLFIGIILGLISWQVYSASPVWKVSKGDSYLYLGGTIHLLAEQDLPLPAQFDLAYSKASSLIFETDIAALESPEFLAKMMQVMSFTDEQTLSSSLKPEVYAALQQYLKTRGIAEENVAKFTPTGISLSIQLLEYQRLGMNPEAGVDRIYTKKAIDDGKTIGHLETPEEQLSFIANMGRGKENELVQQTLAEAQTAGEKINQLKRAWRSGNNAFLAELAITDMKIAFPHMYDTLLIQRNKKWLPKIEAMLANKEVELVLVGALHLAGEDGLLDSLSKKGYDLENL